MTTASHQTYVYVGLGGEGENIGEGGLYRRAEGDDHWESITKGLPENPQVRALLVHPDNPEIVYAGTNEGPYRSDDRGGHWEPLDALKRDVWSLAFHPNDPNTVYAGYEPCAVYRSQDGGGHWDAMNTDGVVYPHITTYMPPLGKRVIGLAADPSNPDDMYGAIEVGGLIGSRDGGESWTQLLDGPYVRNNTLDLHGVQVSSAAPGTVFIITQVAMFRSRDRGRYWEHIRVEDMFPGGSYCRGLLVDPSNPQTIYLASGAGGGGAPAGTQEEGALFRSRDTGETWDRVDIGDAPPKRMFQIAVDRASPQNVYCCDYDGRVFASSDGGEQWRTTSQVPGEMSRYVHVYPMVCG